MPKRSSRKPSRDENVSAVDAVRRLTGQDEPEETQDEPEPTPEERRRLAAILGRAGGRKGGPARAEKLSAKRRKEIARKAAKARWADRDEPR